MATKIQLIESRTDNHTSYIVWQSDTIDPNKKGSLYTGPNKDVAEGIIEKQRQGRDSKIVLMDVIIE